MSFPPRSSSAEPARASLFLGTIMAAYVGVYLCRKNLTVAVPLLQQEWGLAKEQVGMIGSLSTVAYAAGKVFFGPVTDRVGGRAALIGSMLLVALFGAAGAFAPSLAGLTLLYSTSRLAGAASWGAMLKLVPEWFGASRLALACGLLSLSFVFGGALAIAFGGLVARLAADSWRAILGVPSLVLACLAVLVWAVIPRPKQAASTPAGTATGRRPPVVRIRALFLDRTFLVVLALSFTLTLVRETFNFWTVDFIRTEAGAEVSNSLAAFLSMPFDICGALGIVLAGWLFGRLSRPARQAWLAVVLVLLALLLWLLPAFFHVGLWALTIGVGLIGFLAYGPYSLLAGVLAVEVGGKESVATVAGYVDGVGYLAGILSGVFFGQLLTLGGYRLGFHAMAGLTALAALLTLFLYPKPVPSHAVPARGLDPSPEPNPM